jgi:hypothetical protein
MLIQDHSLHSLTGSLSRPRPRGRSISGSRIQLGSHVHVGLQIAKPVNATKKTHRIISMINAASKPL